MSNEMQLRPSDNLPDLPPDRYGYGPGEYNYRGDYSESQVPEETLFHKIHRLMSGRYHWAILLGGLIGAVLGGYLYKTSQPLWSSTGTIQVKAVVFSPLGRDANPYPFEMLKETQLNILRGQRLAELAMQKESWQGVGRDTTSVDALIEFLGSINVLTTPKSEIIEVKFTDSEPKAAEAGIRSVMMAYRQLQADEAAAMEKLKLDTLKDYRDESLRKLNDARDRLRALAQDNYGTDDLREVHRGKIEEMTRYSMALGEAKLAREGVMTPKPKAPQDDQKTPGDVNTLSVEQIADQDSRMADLLDQKTQAQARIEFLKDKVGPNNHEMIKAVAGLADVEARIKERRRQFVAGGGRTLPPVPGITPGMTPEQLDQTIAKLIAMRDEAQKSAKEIGDRMMELEKIKKSIAQLEGPIELLEERIREELMRQLQDRIRVVSESDRARIVKDSKLQRGAAGGLGGLALGFFIVLFFSMFDRRFRTPEEARTAGRMALLGVLPNLPDDLSDPEQAAIAAHCVHQIRTLLQISTPGDDRHVFAVTSPAAGTGKTSLCLSLGVSFAASQSRTLLIDGDLIGGGLTIRVDAIVRRKIGQILKREGLVTQQQLEMAMKLARNSHKKFGEILVELGHLNKEDVERALAQQEESPVGLLDALAGEELLDCIAETGIAGLSILPLGSAMPNDVSKLSPNTVRALLARAKEHFDTVIIDTGPVPGSLEASLVAKASDGVVMVVSRGEHRPVVERAIQHLRDIGAPIAGMVFNRADNYDVELSNTTSRLSSFDRTRTRRAADSQYVPGVQNPLFGPLAQSMTPRDGNGQ